MKITIESTNKIIEGQGRIWRGITPSGVRCIVLVAAIGSETDEDLQAIQAELATLPTLGRHAIVAMLEDETVQCGQQECTKKAIQRFLWPGHSKWCVVCPTCMLQAVRVAEALGFELVIEPLPNNFQN